MNHLLGHKTNLDKFKKIEILLNIFSGHSGTKVEVTNRRKIGKFVNKISAYSINIQKLGAFLYINKKLSETEIKKENIIYDSIKIIKYLEINLTKEVKDLYTEN